MNRRIVLMSIVMVVSTLGAWAQKSTYKGFPSLVWPKLYDIRFEKAKDDLGEYDKPIFSEEVKKLNGKVITLPGYIVPFDNGMKAQHFMFTSLPLNACFFCGVGGPETVIEVNTSEIITYTDKPVEIKGTLRLNASNPDQMIYILDKAEVVGEVGF